MYKPDKLFPLSVPDAPVEAVRFTPDLRGLIAFCESKPADEVYCFMDIGHCLFAQFFTACGFDDVSAGSYYYRHGPHDNVGGRERHAFPHPSFAGIAENGPHTFGEALQRSACCAMNIRPSILDRNPATAEHFASLMEKAPGPLEDLFGTKRPVLLNVEFIRGEPAVEAFIASNGRSAERKAYDDAESPTDPTYARAGHRGTIELFPDGTWRLVQLFRSE